MISKIREVTPIGDPYTTPQGRTLYTIGITLEDGTKGIANAVSNEPWYAAPGTEVEITETGRTKNDRPKWKVARVQDDGGSAPQKPSSAPRKAPGDTKGIEVGQALNKAVDILIATDLKEHGLNPETFPDKLYDLAVDIYRVGKGLRDNEEL